MIYKLLIEFDEKDFYKSLREKNYKNVLEYIISICMNGDDYDKAFEICSQCSTNIDDDEVRRACLIGFGTLGWRFKRINSKILIPFIKQCLNSNNRCLQGTAEDTINDLEHHVKGFKAL